MGVKEYGGNEQLVSVTSQSYQLVTISFTTGSTNTSAMIDIGKNAGTDVSYGDDFEVSQQ